MAILIIVAISIWIPYNTVSRVLAFVKSNDVLQRTHSELYNESPDNSGSGIYDIANAAAYSEEWKADPGHVGRGV